MSGDGDPSTTTDTDEQAGDVESSISHLRVECEKAWDQVKETQQQLDQSRLTTSVAHAANQQPLISILREKERRLRAEIAVTKDVALQTLPNDHRVGIFFLCCYCVNHHSLSTYVHMYIIGVMSSLSRE